MKFTELENKVLEVLSNPNGNGEKINAEHGDYVELFNFKMSGKILRGVLSSLIQKGIIRIYNDSYGNVIEFTTTGYKEVNRIL